ncbi:hypothetical protein WMY93_026538 [Mugilogobius chulae]|uniref:H15 domain-containing protein n=1 Tax=Mugilogobius chulae TaxID=88201 RepID=A0AAW0NAE6_9GOBI
MGRKAQAKTVMFTIPEESENSADSAGNGFAGTTCMRPLKSPAGKGLGKAGAKRLGRLLKRAVLSQESAQPEPPRPPGSTYLVKTPVRLFKHQILNTGVNSAQGSGMKRASPQVSQLILSLVSQCRQKGGMNMTELKQTLATEGYDVAKNNKHVTVVAKRLLNNKKLVQTRGKNLKINKAPEKTHPKSTNVPKTQARKTLKPESKRSKSAVKRHGKTQTRTQRSRARVAKRKPKLKASKNAEQRREGQWQKVKTHAGPGGLKHRTQDSVKLLEMGGVIRTSDIIN